MFQYTKKTKEEAIGLFQEGLGYKATASILGIPSSTVRDWKRQWNKGEFQLSKQTYPEALKLLMEKEHKKFIWINDTDLLLKAYHMVNGVNVGKKYDAHRVLLSLQSSVLFERINVSIGTKNSHSHPVFKLVEEI